MHINVIGAGLAGCEAAMQIASCGIKVNLYEMKPNKKTPAHHTEKYAELVCSNSLSYFNPCSHEDCNIQLTVVDKSTVGFQSMQS